MKKTLSLLALLLALLMMLSACGKPAGEEDAGDGTLQSVADGDIQPTDSDGSSDITQGNDPVPESIVPAEPGKSYEEYLSALTMQYMTLDYPDFQINGIYTASAVAVESRLASQGIYVFFDSMGESLCAYVYPLAVERSEAGTIDLFSNGLGFAAFDLQAELPSTDGLTLLEPAAYGALLSELDGLLSYMH